MTLEEAAFGNALLGALGAGERQSLAIAKAREGILLTNESRVAHCCRQHRISCARLPDILRALWVEGIATKQEAQTIIQELQIKDRMQFKQATLAAIFADEP
jgi:hypothetical protein